MKLFPLLCCIGLALAGCQVTPDVKDTTNALMRFRIHYQHDGMGTPFVERMTTTSTGVYQCVYVTDPFGISVNAVDPGGIRSIVISPTISHDTGFRARANPGDQFAFPAPAEKVLDLEGGMQPNPGVWGHPSKVAVMYSEAQTFGNVTLFSPFEFGNAIRMPMRATVRNWRQSAGVAEIWEYWVEKAQPADPARQPGMPCYASKP